MRRVANFSIEIMMCKKDGFTSIKKVYKLLSLKLTMADNKSYVGDIGTRVRSYLSADITNVSGITYYWRKPVLGSPTTTEIAEHVGSVESYVSGVVYYDTVDGDFNTAGEYRHQVKVVYINGNTYRSYARSFMIYDHFE